MEKYLSLNAAGLQHVVKVMVDPANSFYYPDDAA